MSPESIDSTVIAASCSSCEPGLTNEAASAVVSVGAAAGVDLQIRPQVLRTAAAAVDGLVLCA